MQTDEKFGFGCGLVSVASMLACIAAWATHVIVCIQTAQWLFLIAGAIAFPVAIVHGFGIWFGAW